MTGSGLFDFVITLIVLVATGVMFFIVIDKAAPDPTMNRVAKIAVGTVFAIIILLAIKGLLFGGGAIALSAGGLIQFAIGIIIILVVLYLLDVAMQYIAAFIVELLANVIKVVIFAAVLIALLVLVDKTMMGGRYTGALGNLETPQIMKPERR